MNRSSSDLLKQRAVIEFLSCEGVQPIEIHRRLEAVYGDETMDVSNVRKWVLRAKSSERGQMNIHDAERPGRPVTVTDELHHNRVDEIVRNNRRVRQSEIALQLGISKERVQAIISNLNYRKICARWVPRLLTEQMKKKRVDACVEFLARYRRDGDQFLHNIVTGDESWIHHYDPESKRASMEFRHPSSPGVRKPKTQASAGKVMLTAFWDAEGVVHIEFLQKGSTINSDSYCDTLQKLKTRTRRIRPDRTTFFLHHDNARPHCSQKTLEKISRLNFEVVTHPPYSPDLAPCDFYLFPKLKENIRGVRYGSDEEVIDVVTTWLRNQDQQFFFNGFKKWIERLEKCVSLNGDYVEK